MREITCMILSHLKKPVTSSLQTHVTDLPNCSDILAKSVSFMFLQFSFKTKSDLVLLDVVRAKLAVT